MRKSVKVACGWGTQLDEATIAQEPLKISVQAKSTLTGPMMRAHVS